MEGGKGEKWDSCNNIIKHTHKRNAYASWGFSLAFGVGVVNFDKAKPIMAEPLSVTTVSVGCNHTLANCTARKLPRETSGNDFPYCKNQRYVEKPSPNSTFFGTWKIL